MEIHTQMTRKINEWVFPKTSPKWRRLAGCLLLAGVAATSAYRSAFAEEKEPGETVAPGTTVPLLPLGLDPIPVPDDNKFDPAKVELGKMLYFDERLSMDNTVSCASCHHPDKGWGSQTPVATGINGQKGGRKSPTVLNSCYNTFQFWDGRAGSLEEQALGPITNPIEMGMPNLKMVEDKLNAIPGYKKEFEKVFGDPNVNSANIAKAIAAFERTIVSGNSPYDRYTEGDKSAMSASAIRGMNLFFDKAHCAACHSGPTFTDHAFHNIGVSIHEDETKMDIGRYQHSKLLGDRGSFKTPALRDIAKMSPYMHDGSMATLEEVIEHYNKGGTANEQLDEEMFPLELTDAEKKDLLQFLVEGLSSDSYPQVKAPKLPQ